MRQSGRVRANVLMVLRGPDGREKGRWEFHNTEKTAGKDGRADQLLASPTLAKPLAIAIGTGTPGATALGAEVARVAFTSKTRSGEVVTMVADFGAGVGTGTITEVGLFDNVSASSGSMWCCGTCNKDKEAADTLQVTWTYNHV